MNGVIRRRGCPAMSLCAYCGAATIDPGALCPHHHTSAHADDWATGNRIMCDFVHRGIVPPGPSQRARSEVEILLERLDVALGVGELRDTEAMSV